MDGTKRLWNSGSYHLLPQKQHPCVIENEGDDAQQNQTDSDLEGAGRRCLQMDHHTHGRSDEDASISQ
jgi:hypothetical protein